MKIGDIYKTDNKGRKSSDTYVRIIDVFEPGTYQYKYEKEKIGSEGKGIKGILIKYERCENIKFEFCYTNYMKRTDFLYNFKKFNLITK